MEPTEQNNAQALKSLYWVIGLLLTAQVGGGYLMWDVQTKYAESVRTDLQDQIEEVRDLVESQNSRAEILRVRLWDQINELKNTVGKLDARLHGLESSMRNVERGTDRMIDLLERQAKQNP